MSGPAARMDERLDEIIAAMCAVAATVGRGSIEGAS